MLQHKFREPAQTECAAPNVFVPKKDGTVRFYDDYRRLNVLTKRDSYPIPRMAKCIDFLAKATIFSALDSTVNTDKWKWRRGTVT